MIKRTPFVIGLTLVAILLASCNGNNPTTSGTQPTSTIEPTSITSGSTSLPTTSEPPDPGDYYASIDNSLTGQSLINALNSLNNKKLQKRVGYKEMLNKPVQGFYVTDPGESGEKYSITTFYSGKEREGTSGLNREHVWPASRTVGGRDNDPLEDDIHTVRPTLAKENEDRGNSFYVEGKCDQSKGWDPKTAGLQETYRGDAARIIFYCAIADTRLTLVDKDNDGTSNHTMGKLSDLLKWNLEYNVLRREVIRNEGAQQLQGNRNPFIDHPEYACRIWGTKNAETKRICGM